MSSFSEWSDVHILYIYLISFFSDDDCLLNYIGDKHRKFYAPLTSSRQIFTELG